ncbi:hypothetical protein GKE82_10480 [Conexibacter sp. W3-3-2]|uniref:hypothetical protein n=1 Tax=Conexibacter sp. W3-3-2 TaxID=2675227 RepID=UPI0012B75F7C|nr:hypothetical protein [Conexibacter sp. W3-3-2]MTD44704.1 hypothetical protein [Conexibacter sp. W3-3-2]
MLALSLDALAARLTGADPAVALAEPERWAYALREAVALARPDMLVLGWDGGFETGALATVVGGAADPVDAIYDADRPLCEQPQGAALVTLVGTLRQLFGGRPRLALAVRGPAALADGLGAPADDELADLCADQLVDLLLACAAVGIDTVVLRGEDQRADGPVVRALDHARVALVRPGMVELLPAASWSTIGASELAAARAAPHLVLSDGPVPGNLELERLAPAR